MSMKIFFKIVKVSKLNFWMNNFLLNLLHYQETLRIKKRLVGNSLFGREHRISFLMAFKYFKVR